MHDESAQYDPPGYPFYQEMRANEVEALLGAGIVVILPVGSLEAHGPHLPLGTDALISEAFAVRLAQKMRALVMPPLPYGYAPTTLNLPASLSVPSQVLHEILLSICQGLGKKGCRRMLLLNIHKENSPPLTTLIHELYSNLGIRAFYLNPYSCFAQELDREFWAGVDNPYKEAALFLAACQVLAKDHLGDPVRSAATIAVVRPERIERLRHIGTIGFRYGTAEAHMPPREGVSLDLGMRYLESVTDRIIDSLSDYTALTDEVNE
jgi:creatinine amidohydrolase/Fe(II)-dependent formamide hydrolase-like protein